MPKYGKYTTVSRMTTITEAPNANWVARKSQKKIMTEAMSMVKFSS